MKNIKNLIPYLLITIICIGGVEYFYSYVENKIERLSKKDTTKEVLASPEVGNTVSVEKQYNYQVIVERNLFGGSLTAKDIAKEEVLLDELDATLLDIVLLGTITGSKNERRAIILDKSTNIQELYQKGDGIQGAIIKEILRGRIILNFRGKDEVLNMNTDKDTMSQPVSVSAASRPRSILPTPRSQRASEVSGSKVRKVRPSRKFSYKNRKKQNQ